MSHAGKGYYKKSKSLLQALYLEFPDREDVRTAYALTLTSLAGNFLYVDGNIEQGRSTAIEAQKVISGTSTITPETSNILGTAYIYEGVSYTFTGDYETARSLLREGIEKLNATPIPIRDTLDVQQVIANLWNTIGDNYGTEGNMAEAITAFDKSMTVRRNLLAASENEPTIIRNITSNLLSLTRAQGMSGQFEEALKSIEEAHQLATQSVKQDPDDIGSKELLVSANSLYGNVLAALNRGDEAEKKIDEAVVIGREVSQKNADVARGPMVFIGTLGEASEAYIGLGRMDKACPLLNEAITLFENFQKTSELPESVSIESIDPMKKMFEQC